MKTERVMLVVLQYLDNKHQQQIAAIKSKNLRYQLGPPHDHRLNPIKFTFQIFKNHFIVMLAGCDKRFPKNNQDPKQ